MDDVDAGRLELERLLVQELGKAHRHLDPVAIMLVGDGVDDGHRPRQSEFELAPRMRARDRRLGRMHRALALQRAGHRRHLRRVAVVADAHGDTALEVDAVDRSRGSRARNAGATARRR